MPYNKAWGEYIPDKTINKAIEKWHRLQPPRVQTSASPSSLTECPMVVWLKKHDVPFVNEMGWGKKQRMLLGRQLESLIVKQLGDDGKVLCWWQDDVPGQSVKLEHGSGLDHISGTPDLLLQLHKVAISDAKTSRSDSFNYVPVEAKDIWADPYWYKYKLQLTAYFLLCHWNKAWFDKNKLPLPEICHLFSYALDDGIVRRELTWKPTRGDVHKVMELTRRWNRAYVAKTMPKCTCKAEGNVKFCPYGVMKKGAKTCTTCCADELIEKVSNEII